MPIVDRCIFAKYFFGQVSLAIKFLNPATVAEEEQKSHWSRSKTMQPPALDLEDNPVPGQIASAILDLEGNVVKGTLSAREASLLFQMLVEAGSLQLSDFKRLTVTVSPTIRYVISRDETHVFVVQTRSS